MKKITFVIEPTTGKCHCGGNIVQIFVKKYGEGNGIIGPGSHRSSRIESDGFGCHYCGNQFGLPIYQRTKPDEETVFQFNLSEATTIRKITVDDLKPVINLVSGKKVKERVGNQEMQFTHMNEKSSKPKLPKELKNLAVGTALFVVQTEDRDPHNQYSTIQLTNKKGEQTFQIRHHCLS